MNAQQTHPTLDVAYLFQEALFNPTKKVDTTFNAESAYGFILAPTLTEDIMAKLTKDLSIVQNYIADFCANNSIKYTRKFGEVPVENLAFYPSETHLATEHTVVPASGCSFQNDPFFGYVLYPLSDLDEYIEELGNRILKNLALVQTCRTNVAPTLLKVSLTIDTLLSHTELVDYINKECATIIENTSKVSPIINRLFILFYSIYPAFCSDTQLLKKLFEYDEETHTTGKNKKFEQRLVDAMIGLAKYKKENPSFLEDLLNEYQNYHKDDLALIKESYIKMYALTLLT